jgi:hypothetical protein
MRGEIQAAEHLREIAGERLRLVAPGEEHEPLGIGGAQMRQPLGDDAERLLPLDFLELAGAARAHTPERLAQPGRGKHVHDPGRALGAQHPAIDRVLAVALDIAELPIP